MVKIVPHCSIRLTCEIISLAVTDVLSNKVRPRRLIKKLMKIGATVMTSKLRASIRFDVIDFMNHLWRAGTMTSLFIFRVVMVARPTAVILPHPLSATFTPP